VWGATILSLDAYLKPTDVMTTGLPAFAGSPIATICANFSHAPLHLSSASAREVILPAVIDRWLEHLIEHCLDRQLHPVAAEGSANGCRAQTILP